MLNYVESDWYSVVIWKFSKHLNKPWTKSWPNTWESEVRFASQGLFARKEKHQYLDRYVLGGMPTDGIDTPTNCCQYTKLNGWQTYFRQNSSYSNNVYDNIVTS